MRNTTDTKMSGIIFKIIIGVPMILVGIAGVLCFSGAYLVARFLTKLYR